jgi:hypothetical protein
MIPSKISAGFILGLIVLGSARLNADPTCQINVQVTGGATGRATTFQGSFQMDPATNVFHDLAIRGSSESPLRAGGHYLENIASLNFPDVYTTITFNPQTKSAVSVTQLGVRGIVTGSSLQCDTPLNPPSCGAYVANLYRSVLGRDGEGTGLAAWTDACATGRLTRDQIQVAFYKSEEFVTKNVNYRVACGQNIRNLYHQLLSREPDASGFDDGFAKCSVSPAGLGEVAEGILSSAEYAQGHTSSTDPTCQISLRAAGPSGVTSELKGTFQMNPQTNVFYNIAISGPGGVLRAGGNYLGNIASFSFPDAYVSLAFSPRTNRVISVSQLGVRQTVESSAVSCQPELKAPSCNLYVTHLYQSILGREPDSGSLASWTAACNSGQLTRDQIQADFYKSPEFAAKNTNYRIGCANNVANFYHQFLHRELDVDGFDYWYAQCIQGPEALGQIAQGFLASEEYQRNQSALGAASVLSASSSPKSLQLHRQTVPPSGPRARQYIGSNRPDRYTPVISAKGQAQMRNLEKLTREGTPNAGSAAANPHDVVEK